MQTEFDNDTPFECLEKWRWNGPRVEDDGLFDDLYQQYDGFVFLGKHSMNLSVNTLKRGK